MNDKVTMQSRRVKTINKLLVAIGVITIFIALAIAAYGLWITKPETGIAIEVFIGAAVGLLGLFIAYLGYK